MWQSLMLPQVITGGIAVYFCYLLSSILKSCDDYSQELQQAARPRWLMHAWISIFIAQIKHSSVSLNLSVLITRLWSIRIKVVLCRSIAVGVMWAHGRRCGIYS